jgi:DHA2 family methylenomycin A resistance protein-like MFS transporter
MAVIGMGGLTYGLIEGGAEGFAAPNVLVALAVAVAGVALFFVAQARGAHPMVPLDLFGSRPVAVSIAGGFAFTVAFYGLVFLLSLYFQEIRGLSAPATGLAFVPMTGLTGVVTLAAPRIAARLGPRVPMASGQILMAVGLLSLCAAVGWAPIWLVAALTILVGLGSSLSVPTLTAVLMNSVPGDRAGVASGVLNTCRQLGGALAVAVFGALVAHRETFLQGLVISLASAAVLLLATAVASLRLPKATARPRTRATASAPCSTSTAAASCPEGSAGRQAAPAGS